MLKKLSFLLHFIMLNAAVLQPILTTQPWESCPSGNQKVVPASECHPPENLGIAHRRVVAYYENGCFEKELAEVVKQAKKKFNKPATSTWQAFIFDIDDTVLSDYCNVKSIQFGFVPEFAHDWITRAEVPAIPLMKNFYNYLIKKGYHIIFLTGRPHNQYEATEKNLQNQGFTAYDKLILRSGDHKGLSTQAYKALERSKLVKEGYEIVGTAGDQWSDLTGDHIGTPIKVPNYMYFIE